jgi:hypothetical protein
LADLRVGRSKEREELAGAVFATNGTRRPVVVSGMAGVGKSYLVDRFFWENMGGFPAAMYAWPSTPPTCSHSCTIG